jgi:hypothetical protein
MPSGGARANAGRKTKFGESSKKLRVPGSWTNEDLMEAIAARDTLKQMRTVVENWRTQGNLTEKADAIHLLQKLETLLFNGTK